MRFPRPLLLDMDFEIILPPHTAAIHADIDARGESNTTIWPAVVVHADAARYIHICASSD
ncbi:hypothetical protein [Algoriphagus sp.]|uniref:hypothetical protein n=1 Tax=Algoriphagus sp. TaxID=1872435 RepID=UPI00327DF0E3